jgi:hypothetical protein
MPAPLGPRPRHRLDLNGSIQHPANRWRGDIEEIRKMSREEEENEWL